MNMYVLDEEFKAVLGQQTRFYHLDEAIAEASKFTRKMNRSLKIWEYRNSVRALVGFVEPDGTLVKPPKEITSLVTALYDGGHKDLADELLES